MKRQEKSKAELAEELRTLRERLLELERAEVEGELAEQALKTALEESRRRGTEISSLLEGSRAVLRYRNFADAARRIFDSCKNLIGAAAGYVALLTKDGTENDVVFLDSGGLPCTVDPSLPMPVRGLRAEAYRTGNVVYDNDFSTSEWTRFMPEGHVDLDNVMFAPLTIDSKVVGLLGLANKPGGFTDNDARIAQAFGELASIALLNSRTFEFLEESEERLRSVVETANDAIIAADGRGNVVFWNRGAESIFGYSAEEIVGEPLTTIMPQRLHDAHRKGLARVVSTGKTKLVGRTVEMTGLRKDGTESPIELSLATWRTREGVFFTAVCRDITDRKRVEEAVRNSQRFLEIANRYSGMEPLLAAFVAEVKSLTGCDAVGVRILDDEGNIPYEAYDGFDREFYESENPLSIETNQCMCVNVIKGDADPKLPFYTENGSFYINGTTRFLATVSEEEKGQTRNKCNEHGYESVALIPILLGNSIVGLIHVADTRENMVPLEKVQILEGIAMQLGVAIQRARAEEELRRYRHRLEELVEERTAELGRSHQQLRILAGHLQTAREEERSRVAREIHDELGQVLTGLEMDLSWLTRRLSESADGQSRGLLLDKIGSMLSLVDRTIESVQRIATELRPGVLDDFGVLAAIESQTRQFKERTGIKCDLILAVGDAHLDGVISTALFRIIQEALTNVARHAEATKVAISLRLDGDKLRLVIRDDGKGIPKSEISRSTSLGFLGMRERAVALGGEFHVDSARKKGTVIKASIPLGESADSPVSIAEPRPE